MADTHGGYLVSGPSGDHLPTRKGGKLDHHLMGAAWAALHGGYRGNKYEGPGKAEAIAKLKKCYEEEGMSPPGANRVVIFNRASKSREGWIHIVPRGELPNAEAGIVQVLDQTSLDSIYNRLVAEHSPEGAPGLYAGREHFIYDSDKDSEALGWFKVFNRDDDGIWASADGLTDIGREAVKNKRYKFTSFVADSSDLKKMDGNKYRVMNIETVGFTNMANGKSLLAPITNRDFAGAGAAAANQQKPTKGNKMQKVAQLLGLAAEASEEAILEAVTKIRNRGDITPEALATLRAEHKTLGEENQTLLGEQCDALMDAHGIKKDDKVRNRLRPALIGSKTREDRMAMLGDFGFKPVEAAKSSGGQTKLYNRETKMPGAAATETDGPTAEEKTRATKVMNRARELRKEMPSLSLLAATRMAEQQFPVEA